MTSMGMESAFPIRAPEEADCTPGHTLTAYAPEHFGRDIRRVPCAS